MEAILKARNFANLISGNARDQRVLAPSLFQPPPGNTGYVSSAYHWTQVLKLRFW